MKKSHKVFVADKLSAEGVAVLEQAPTIEVDFMPGLAEDEVVARVADADAVIVRSATSINARVLDAAGRLKVIGRAGIGVDNIDVAAATERGIVVLNTPDANATTTAELAVAHLMSLNRHLPQADRSVKAGEWRRGDFVGTELTGKTIGVVGFGTIGRIVADRCRGLKMHVLGFDPFVTEETFRDAGVEPADLDSMLAAADYITLHCPLTDGTRNIIGAEAIAKMKRGAGLINCARGGLVDEAALAAAVESGQLAGAALDVFESEPPTDTAVLASDRILLTPHLGASTREAQVAVGTEIAAQVITFLDTGQPVNAINLPRISAEALQRLEPYQVLGRQLGRLLSQMSSAPLKNVEVGLFGDAASVQVAPLVTEVQVGMLQDHLSAPVNQVNAAHFAQRQGLSIAHKVSESSRDFVSLLRLTGDCENECITVEGTLYDGRHPRLVRINDYDIEAPLTGHTLFTRHVDQPGVIGDIGTILGENGINIARMNVGVGPGSNRAIAMLGIGQPLEDAVLDRLRALPAIEKVMQIEF